MGRSSVPMHNFRINMFLHIYIQSPAPRSHHMLNDSTPPKLMLALTPNPSRANRYIIIPESIRIPAIRLPAKVDPRNLRLEGAPLPLRPIRIANARLDREPRDRRAVQPRLDAAVGAKVVLEAAPLVRGERRRACDALRRQIRERRVVAFAVVHEDFALAADAEVLLCALGRVGHRDEGHVGVGEGFGGFPGGVLVWCLSIEDAFRRGRQTYSQVLT
jgi:hypothetical protein